MHQKHKLETELKGLYDDKCKGYMVRSRVQWVEEGERSTRYFLKMEKGVQSNNVIKKIRTGDKISISNDDILNDILSFYEKLYSKANINNDNVDVYFQKIANCKVLNNVDKQKCEADVSVSEIKYAIFNLNNNKSPGPDGLTPEFYKCFYNDIVNLYHDMLVETFQYGELPESLKLAILTLIFKKGDKDLLKNYRPISLTNYDYKILAYILAQRMQNVIKSIINEDQSAYIKGRYIGCNVRTIEDLMHYCDKFDVNGSLICLDFEKAFDSVNWYFLMSCLKKFNFGKKFIKWIQIFYNDPKICIKNNGHISKSFTAGRGIRQGCPVSALLWLKLWQ